MATDHIRGVDHVGRGLSGRTGCRTSSNIHERCQGPLLLVDWG